MRSQAEIRFDIDRADDEIVRALGKRFALAREMRALKAATGLKPVDPERERAIMARVLEKTEPAERDTVCSIYERILGGSRGFIETIARGVCIEKGRVLLCRAKGGATTYLPGGHIEFGETGAEALVREIREETGCAATAGDFLGVEENVFDQHGKRHAEINLIYRLSVEDAANVRAQEDWISFEWVPLEELANARLLPTSIARHVHL